MRFEKVIAINPPSPPGYVANRDSMGGYGQLYPIGATPFPPLDLPYLVAYLAQHEVNVEVVETLGGGLDVEAMNRRISELAASQPTLVVVRTALCSLDWDMSVCATIKQASPHVKLAVYGSILPHVRPRVEQEASLDYILLGEPDETVRELAEGRAEDEILGLTFLRDGAWIERPARPFLKDLDSLPFPDWEALPYQRYALPASSASAQVPFLPMLTSRGCPFGCHYCPYPLGQGLPFRRRSAKNVVDEIEHLVRDLGIQYILFRDPVFTLRQDRVAEICREIQARGLKFRWKCETRPDCVTEDLLQQMAAAGCEGINFGVESAEAEIQAGVGRKPITREKIIEIVDICRKLKLKTFCFFIIGLPGDTVRSVLKTIDLGVRLRSNWIQFTAASPFMGTKLRAWAVTNNLTPDNEYSYRSSHEAMMGNGNLTLDQVRGLHHFAQFLQRYLINRGGILKDENRSGFLYGTARTLANWASAIAARTAFAIGRVYFELAYREVPPPAQPPSILNEAT